MTSLLAGIDAPAVTTPPAPSFGELGVPDAIVAVLAARGITSPLPIQAATLPEALAGRDLCGKAPTGSGKTLAFAIPLAAAVTRAAPRRPRALVLAPTRELAAQITTELQPLLAASRVRAHPFYGGVGFGGQLNALRKGVDVAVACPGRLEDLLARGELRLSEVEIVVIDEADRMVDMGFLPAVRRILDQTTARRQTLLFSATLDGDVDVVVRHYLHQPVRHEVEVQDDQLSSVTHRFHGVEAADRSERCAEVIASAGSSVVFVRTKHSADRVARQLERLGVSSAAIHGDRSQPQRERALAAFRDGKVQALVATDVAARGIHVDDVACVIHYDLPEDAKAYVHRSGRTARAGASGMVVALVTSEHRKAAAAIERELGLEVEYVGMSRPEPAHAAGSNRRPSSPPRRRRPSNGSGGGTAGAGAHVHAHAGAPTKRRSERPAGAFAGGTSASSRSPRRRPRRPA